MCLELADGVRVVHNLQLKGDTAFLLIKGDTQQISHSTS
jgi:hypothetical protein